MTINQARIQREKLFEQTKTCTDIVELGFLGLKINILNAHIKGDLPL